MTKEQQRLQEEKERTAYWRRWGPYLSERQWGTVREDYSPDGNAWAYFPHDHAPMRAYRWGEDGIAGISDNHQRLCFALALWNGQDPILKERLFGLSGADGNHGEDVKEYYYYLDNTPTHSYMKYLYKYPQAAFPYQQLIEENRQRDRLEKEFELVDTKIFDQDRYFDIFVEYAKESPEAVFIKITACNRGPETHTLHLVPTLWFRNLWMNDPESIRPSISLMSSDEMTLKATHPTLGTYYLRAEGGVEPLFTENETNCQRLYGEENPTRYVKDGFHERIIQGKEESVNPDKVGTKAGFHYCFDVGAGQEQVVYLHLSTSDKLALRQAESVFLARKNEADAFYDNIIPKSLSKEQKEVERQAFAGMLWTKQFYNYVVEEWLEAKTVQPAPSPLRKKGRNHEWTHLYNDDVLSMPDKWEYPWFASWDMAFHCIPLTIVDAEFAKRQLMRLTREWYMHPNGQIPAYEWNFSDVNPPVHAWAAWRLYKIEKKWQGKGDLLFLESVFQKLLLNFTWWVNRKDLEGKNIFQGGFLGLDNISIFDRSAKLPTGGYLNQSDATSWMGMFCLNMLTIALELACYNKAYEDIASKFFEHFLRISDAMTRVGKDKTELWNRDEGFFYDVVHLPDGTQFPLKVRSFVGLIPLFAVMTLEQDLLDKLSGFGRRFEWFLDHRKDLCEKVACMRTPGEKQRRLLSIVDRDKLRSILSKVLDEKEFLSDYGIRSVSAFHREHPFTLSLGGKEYCTDYEPAESTTDLFGGNSNWRGPIWFPLNFLLIESLQKFHYYLGDDFKVECPTGSKRMVNLWDVSRELSQRLIKIFIDKGYDDRAVFAAWPEKYRKDPHWNSYTHFHEYFHGDLGTGLGASHQTGWSGIVAKLLQQHGEYEGHPPVEKPG